MYLKGINDRAFSAIFDQSCTHEQATEQLTMSVINLQYMVIYNYASSVR